MGRGQRNKGNKGELEVAKLILEWWRKVDPKVAITRTPRSGGWGSSAKFGVAGDIVVKGSTDAPVFPFSVEVKRDESWSERWFFEGRPSPVWEWWRQCQRDAERTARQPLLWFRKNNRPWWVLYPTAYERVRIGPEVQVGGQFFSVWRPSVSTLLSVDWGWAMPVAVRADLFLATDPALWAVLVDGTCPEHPRSSPKNPKNKKP